MGEQPLISVVIPTCNRAMELNRAIKSVLAQSFKNFEIVVVDDGSSDETRAMVEAIGNNKINYFSQENRGPAAARNLGIKKANGEFVAFLDDDDTWLKNHLEEAVLFLQQNPGISALFARGIIVAKSKGSEHKKMRMEKISEEYLQNMPKRRANGGYCLDNFFEYLLENGSVFAMSSTVVRKQVLEKLGAMGNMFLCGEDYYLWLRLAKNFGVGFIDKPHCTYYLRAEGIYHSNLKNNEQVCKAELSIFNKLLKEEKLTGGQANLARGQISKALFSGEGNPKHAV